MFIYWYFYSRHKMETQTIDTVFLCSIIVLIDSVFLYSIIVREAALNLHSLTFSTISLSLSVPLSFVSLVETFRISHFSCSI